MSKTNAATQLEGILSALSMPGGEHPDLVLQQKAARRLGFESKDFSIYAFNAMLMNRIADLEERLEAYEKAQKSS